MPATAPRRMLVPQATKGCRWIIQSSGEVRHPCEFNQIDDASDEALHKRPRRGFSRGNTNRWPPRGRFEAVLGAAYRRNKGADPLSEPEKSVENLRAWQNV
jgi:hypothetical protein